MVGFWVNKLLNVPNVHQIRFLIWDWISADSVQKCQLQINRTTNVYVNKNMFSIKKFSNVNNALMAALQTIWLTYVSTVHQAQLQTNRPTIVYFVHSVSFQTMKQLTALSAQRIPSQTMKLIVVCIVQTVSFQKLREISVFIVQTVLFQTMRLPNV
jgi:hypothetical protein